MNALYKLILWALGEISLVQYTIALKRIDDATGRAGNKNLTPEERMKAAKELEDALNTHL